VELYLPYTSGLKQCQNVRKWI